MGQIAVGGTTTTKQVGTLLQSEQARLVGGTAGQEQRDGEDGSAHYQHHLKKNLQVYA